MLCYQYSQCKYIIVCIVIVLLTRWESEEGGTPVGKISIKPGQPGQGGPEVLFKVNHCVQLYTLPVCICPLVNLKNFAANIMKCFFVNCVIRIFFHSFLKTYRKRGRPPRLRRRLPSPKTTTRKTMAKLQAQTFTSGQLQVCHCYVSASHLEHAK